MLGIRQVEGLYDRYLSLQALPVLSPRIAFSSCRVHSILTIQIRPGAKVLYLGAAAGSSVSHVSDIVGPEGVVYAVEFSHRPGRDLIGMAKKRTNVIRMSILRISHHCHLEPFSNLSPFPLSLSLQPFAIASMRCRAVKANADM